MSRAAGVACAGLVALMTGCAEQQRVPVSDHSVIPVPIEVNTGDGDFTLDATVAFALVDPSDERVRQDVELVAGPVWEALGGEVRFDESGAISVGLGEAGDSPEAYELTVSSSGVSIVGSGHAGVFYGLQTLKQLLPSDLAAAGSSVTVPSIEITDSPRFPYRGMHLDVARHFQGPDFVKHYLDLLALYKMNRFHWHLTEDQGWRIQIDAYPRLTEVAAFRAQTQIGHGLDEFNGDGVPHGGFYTKDEIREIVEYAEARHITIIPEIEMPGHAQAALAAYPELACTEGPFEVAQTWGVFEDIFCPKEETFVFLENVLAEVIALFPGEYIHVGGDEAPKTRWEQSPLVQEIMEREGFEDEMEVQSWFIARIERFLNANGKQLIGWDEILEGGLAPNATVMSWRGTVGGIEAAREGHDVVMTPYSHVYFDYYQSEDQESEPFAIGGFLPLDTVYSYEPVPAELTPEESLHILGTQANVWTEYMKTPEHIEYMIFPRMLAISEVAWSQDERKDYDAFRGRVPWHFERFDAMGVNYRPLDGS